MKDCMLTTYDNTFDPFEDFEAWFKEDARLGHYTCGVLALNANCSRVFSDEINEQITFDAMQELVEQNPNLYKIVYKDEKS